MQSQALSSGHFRGILTLRGMLRVEVVVLTGIVNISSVRQAGEVGVVLVLLVSLV